MNNSPTYLRLLRRNGIQKFLCLIALLLGSASLAMDVNQNGVDPKGKALCKAAETGNKKLVQQLLEAGASVNAQDAVGKTPLMLAAWLGHKDICQLLLNAKAQADAKDTDGSTALELAIRAPHKKICQLLIDAHANLNALDNFNATPLMVAAIIGHEEICRLLIEANAEIDIKTKGGMTALMFAAASNHKKICRLLVEAMIKPIIQNKAAAITLMGIKKFRNVPCLQSIDREVIKLIARHIYDPSAITELLAKIYHQMGITKISQDLRNYVLQEMSPKTKSCTLM
jgi:ankyrin repeat protein